jgi:predicted class III extradiol MEMO1 family dioxygenase
MLRRAAVAGHFYQGTSEALKSQVAGYLIPDAEKVRALGILSPHAGLMYSGSVAGAVYSSIELPKTFVLIGPNHTGLGEAVSLMSSGHWETPLGRVAIDEPLAASILSKSPRIREDTLAHLREHSLEVQLPFIQYLCPEASIVPIQMLDTRLETCIEVGRAVAGAIADCGLRNADYKPEEKTANAECTSKIRNPKTAIRNVLIIASSDMSHYEPAEIARKKDHLAIERILDLDPEGLYGTIKNNHITMCGYGPAVAMIVACKALGATRAALIKYSNSGEVSGDYGQVVGYAGMVIV